MQISDTVRQILVVYVRNRLDGGKPVLGTAELAQLAGLPDGTGVVREALATVGEWCTSNGLPNIATAVISADHAEHNLMLPDDDFVEKLGGEAAVRTEQARVRDFDWSHWVES